MLTKQFKWKTSKDEFILPKDMETGHLYHTLKMIYNHTMPLEDRLLPYRQYKFGPYYTKEYIREAIYHLGIELSTRKLTIGWYNNLLTMFLRCKLDRRLIEQSSENNR